jgi:hypothetical protein
MRIRFFSGGAGCGKTYQVMHTLSARVEQLPLAEGEKILALTYMHGSRRRLHERLLDTKHVANKFECFVIDSMAWRIVCRWRSLLTSMGIAFPDVGEFDRICEGAALLLANIAVAKWVAATFPVMILDEAQDLDSVRLRIVQALSTHIEVIAAADEFQCLNETLRPNSACQWLSEMCNPEHLTVPRRTNLRELLNAAHAIRSGNAPVSGDMFKIAYTPNVGLAGSYLSNALGWHGRGQQIAIITPATGRFPSGVTDWVGTRRTRQNNGPFFIKWEHSESQTINRYLDSLDLPGQSDSAHYEQLVTAAADDRTAKDVSNWFDLQRRTQGRVVFEKQDVVAVIKQSFSARKHSPSSTQRGPLAMTVHGAKNREFDMVVVLWPAAIAGDVEQKRRLLYNAVTRAKSRCLVLVESQAALGLPPFA